MDVVLLFPGQGSQKPGMGRDLAARFVEAERAFADADAALGFPLSRLCFDGPSEDLTLTNNAQPALLTHGLAVWSVVQHTLAPHVRAAAGHSLGEFTAYGAAGALSLAAAVQLVRTRGELMLAAGRSAPGSMAAILGDTTEPIERICERASQDPQGGLVVPANFNSPGQTVISGTVAGVQRAMALAKDCGAKRAMALNVSGAFHSPLMAPARDGLAAALADLAMVPPRFGVCANVNARMIDTVSDAKDLLVEQLTAPVRWIAVIETLAQRYPDALYVEMGPGSVLAGLLKKIAPSLRSASCGTAQDVDALLAMVS